MEPSSQCRRASERVKGATFWTQEEGEEEGGEKEGEEKQCVTLARLVFLVFSFASLYILNQIERETYEI